jgi:hypothetical protein
MIGPSGTTQILVATKPVDFRKQADSLAALVQEALGADPFSGTVYVFRAKRTNQTTFRLPIAICDGRVPVASAPREAASPRSADGPSRT